MQKSREIYVPIIKWKRGEVNAIENLDVKVKQSIVPLIEIINKTELGIWKGQRYYFDSRYKDQNKVILYKDILKAVDKKMAIPVLHVDSSIDIILDSINFAESGIAIRVDIGKNTADEILGLIKRLDKYGVEKTDIDLIMDFKLVTKKSIIGSTDKVKELISKIGAIDVYRNVIISSSIIPKTYGKYLNDTLNCIERLEKKLFKEIKRLFNSSDNIIFSDYGVKFHEEPKAGSGGNNSFFGLKYTTDKEIFLVKGYAVNRVSLVKNITKHSKFSGEKFSFGDAEIYKIEIGKKLGTWEQTGMFGLNHHITFVISELKSIYKI